ncbi:Zinc/iron permease [Laetiporus sulphureus 93-53]|uniref:Zinc/iron permease n=1 Tax=Laetiporus sulphureus 93-53 TaxID=1314785 RepID=A0A165D2R5_9APHY|nr:Zinc/iron permease [Laetiporus sulphureus 93-53]KZT04043.1 Zinc/iron permease [Laetiporus sulphureus 93-53]
MFAVFLVSLFASCFPVLSRRIPGICIPGVVFFVGKHFGTGIILVTAFVHLLQDVFEALMNPEVQERYGMSKWVGMIVLSSLLLIFLVEYITTSYVDRLQSYASAPPSPCSMPSLSPASSPTISPTQLPECLNGTPNDRQGQKEDEEDEEGGASHLFGVPLALASPESEQEVDEDEDREAEVDEAMPLIVSSQNPAPPVKYGTNANGHPRPVGYAHTFPHSTHPPHPPAMTIELNRPGDEIFMGGHHRHEQCRSHAEYHACAKGGWRGWLGLGGDDAGLESGSSDCRVANGNGKSRESCTSSGASAMREHECGDWGMHEHEDGGAEAESGNGDKDAAQGQIRRQRQVVGILMLKMGIMLHLLVIGLTLAITSGPEFTSLVTAIMFHQLFEGLSLEIWIATLPAGDERVLKPALALMFTVTTPVGIAIGLAVFGPGESEGVKVVLLTGVMSTLSAGMLIYAACIEMLVGDFVLDPHLWHSSVSRQALTLCALLAGVAAMGVVGIVGE